MERGRWAWARAESAGAPVKRSGTAKADKRKSPAQDQKNDFHIRWLVYHTRSRLSASMTIAYTPTSEYT